MKVFFLKKRFEYRDQYKKLLKLRDLIIFLSQNNNKKIGIFCLLVCHVACNHWATWHTVIFVFFFNLDLREGAITKLLQSVRTNVKQKNAGMWVSRQRRLSQKWP